MYQGDVEGDLRVGVDSRNFKGNDVSALIKRTSMYRGDVERDGCIVVYQGNIELDASACIEGTLISRDVLTWIQGTSNTTGELAWIKVTSNAMDALVWIKGMSNARTLLQPSTNEKHISCAHNVNHIIALCFDSK